MGASRQNIPVISRGKPVTIILDWTIEVGYVTMDVVRRLRLTTMPLPHAKTVGTEDGVLHGLALRFYTMSFIFGGSFTDIVTLDIVPLEVGEVALGNFYLAAQKGYMTDDRNGVELRLHHNWIVEFEMGRVIHFAPTHNISATSSYALASPPESPIEVAHILAERPTQEAESSSYVPMDQPNPKAEISYIPIDHQDPYAEERSHD
ncbi:hypothetical protein KI387_044742, partial [Taxus chinensis]